MSLTGETNPNSSSKAVLLRKTSLIQERGIVFEYIFIFPSGAVMSQRVAFKAVKKKITRQLEASYHYCCQVSFLSHWTNSNNISFAQIEFCTYSGCYSQRSLICVLLLVSASGLACRYENMHGCGSSQCKHGLQHNTEPTNTKFTSSCTEIEKKHKKSYSPRSVEVSRQHEPCSSISMVGLRSSVVELPFSFIVPRKWRLTDDWLLTRSYSPSLTLVSAGRLEVLVRVILSRHARS